MMNRTTRQFAQSPIDVEFSFRVQAPGANNPDGIRDGDSGIVTGVTRASAGVYTVQFDQDDVVTLPQEITGGHVTVHGPDATPSSTTLPSNAYISGLAIDLPNRRITVVTMTANGAGAPAPEDPEDNSWVSVKFRGPINADNVEG